MTPIIMMFLSMKSREELVLYTRNTALTNKWDHLVVGGDNMS